MGSKRYGMIDLHIHSTASDGSLSPAEIISEAVGLKLDAISIVDHDTIEGSKEAVDIGFPEGLEFLTGVEISANPPPGFLCSGSFHILGYRIELDHPGLNRTLKTLQEARKNRNPEIIRRLNDLGIDLSLEAVGGEAETGQIGRPHIARAMVAGGFASSINDAFDRYLGKGRPAYVDKYRLECSAAIEAILQAGGVPVLAHPFLVEIKNDKSLEDLVVSMKSMGLKGIEVYYPEHPPEKTACYADLADRRRLLMTGGTDFHGSLKPRIRMGSGSGDLYVPYELYRRVMESG